MQKRARCLVFFAWLLSGFGGAHAKFGLRFQLAHKAQAIAGQSQAMAQLRWLCLAFACQNWRAAVFSQREWAVRKEKAKD
jgi:hypothetical protein